MRAEFFNIIKEIVNGTSIIRLDDDDDDDDDDDEDYAWNRWDTEELANERMNWTDGDWRRAWHRAIFISWRVDIQSWVREIEHHYRFEE